MGAGAGYTIEVSDAKVVSSVDVSTFTLEKDGGYCTATVPCDVKQKKCRRLVSVRLRMLRLLCHL